MPSAKCWPFCLGLNVLIGLSKTTSGAKRLKWFVCKIVQIYNHATMNLLEKMWYIFILYNFSGPILGLRPANERRRYKVTPSLIDWAQT